jgi:CRISPR-associated protein Csx3
MPIEEMQIGEMQIEVIRLGEGVSADENTDQGQYQTLSITLTKPWQHILPIQLTTLTLPRDLDLNREVVIYGQLPNWMWGKLVGLCSAAPWVGCYNGPAGGVVVVHSQLSSPAVGDLIPIKLNQSLCPAILIGGPPNSGKSVFSNALRTALTQTLPHHKTYLHRASWDGEGNWAYEANTPMVKKFIRQSEFRIHENSETAQLIPAYYQHHADCVKNLRQLSDCVLVDVGGMPQAEKQPLIEQCTHYIVISRLAEAVAQWHAFCARSLQPVAVIHSILESEQTILHREPFLEISAGPWIDSASVNFPQCVLEKCVELYST